MAAGESPNEAFGKGEGAGELTEARSLALARFWGGGRVVGDGVGVVGGGRDGRERGGGRGRKTGRRGGVRVGVMG